MPAVGSQNPRARYNGTWKTWSKFWAKHSGAWKRPISVFVKSGGSWVEVYDEAPTVANVAKQVINFNPGTGQYVTQTNFTLYANGFQTSITVDGSFAKSSLDGKLEAHEVDAAFGVKRDDQAQ
jgi:hypothetical protein